MAGTVTAFYISIGNSDDKLPQMEWAAYCHRVNVEVRKHAMAVHGHWFSEPSQPWQNACWCIEIYQPRYVPELKGALTDIAETYNQESIAWAAVAELEFLRPGG